MLNRISGIEDHPLPIIFLGTSLHLHNKVLVVSAMTVDVVIDLGAFSVKTKLFHIPVLNVPDFVRFQDVVQKGNHNVLLAKCLLEHKIITQISVHRFAGRKFRSIHSSIKFIISLAPTLRVAGKISIENVNSFKKRKFVTKDFLYKIRIFRKLYISLIRLGSHRRNALVRGIPFSR